MGKFQGFLLCSDLDGTFWGQGAEVENQKAVEYFIENGGRFSFATGRTVDFIREKPFFSIVNAPTCLFNGAVVYDFAKGKILRERHLDYTVREFLDAVRDQLCDIQKLVLYRDIHDGGTMYFDIDSLPEDVLDLNCLKLLCVFESHERTLDFKRYCRSHPYFKDTYLSRSWGHGLEFNPKDGTKGDALCFIKETLGDIKVSVGIGDYDNDETLVQRADIGVAVENAVDEVKEAATWQVGHFSKCAVKELIEKLEIEIDKGTFK